MLRVLTAWLAAVTLMIFFSPAVFAQAVSGNINGTVLDSSGAPIPNATVSITDLERGSKYNLQSKSDGDFEQKHLLDRQISGQN